MTVEARRDDYVEANTLAAGGKLLGCGLNYQALGPDHRYRQGALVAVAGSLNLNLVESKGEKTVGILFKVGIKDVILEKQTSIEAPEFAYVTSKNRTTAQLQKS